MDSYAQLAELIDLAESVGITIRRVRAAGDAPEHPGGAMIRLKGKEMLLLDPTAAVVDQLAVAAAALRGRPEIEERFLPPQLRDLIDDAS